MRGCVGEGVHRWLDNPIDRGGNDVDTFRTLLCEGRDDVGNVRAMDGDEFELVFDPDLVITNSGQRRCRLGKGVKCGRESSIHCIESQQHGQRTAGSPRRVDSHLEV